MGGEVDGWRVAISETSPYRQRRLLRVMEARRGDVEFKLIVDDWDAPDE
jgi:outer membrane biogenesis lipoprotein LolB